MSTGGATLHSKYYRESMKRTRMADGYSKSLILHGHGQSMIEFALILPVMVLIIAGIFDLGRAFYSFITITNAAREGARYGSLNPDYMAGVCQATNDELQSSGIPLVDSHGINYFTITVSCASTMTCPVSTAIGCTENSPITVKVSYNYDQMLLKFFFPTGIIMQRQVEMLVP